jgi:hypothetical protein
VFYLDLNTGIYDSIAGLERVLNIHLCEFETLWGKDAAEDDSPSRFAGVIKRAREKTGKPVAVLIDEYDKPLISTLENEELNGAVRTRLKAFYSVLKSADRYLRFALLTGVTKFAHVSVFSDLNHLRDISMEREYSGVCGITETELVENFGAELDALAREEGVTRSGALAEMRKNYNGYHFAGNCEGVYNPFSVLNTFAKNDFRYYWFATGTPTFLVKEIQRSRLDPRNLSGGEVMSEQDIVDYRFGGNPVPLLYQTGYLTIKDYDKKAMEYTLTFPNEEVKYGFLKSLLPEYVPAAAESDFSVRHFLKDLKTGDVDGFMRRFQTFFSSIPYDIRTRFDAEQHYQTVFYLVFTLLGQITEAEVRSEYGRADAVVKTEDAIYVFEFKTAAGGTVEDALAQIDDKGYLLPYAADGRKLVKVGVVCGGATPGGTPTDPQRRNITEWKARV